jgi:gamma-glutamyltranspeptidase/glutathione hydrolase
MPNRIVVCPEPLAAAAGAAIFRAGGSAVDAALATAYAQAVVSPAMTTIAGTGSMNLYHAPSRRNVVIDFLDRAPLCTLLRIASRVTGSGYHFFHPYPLMKRE